MRRKNVDRMVKLGMLTALAVVLVVVMPKIRIFPAVPFLEYDMADVPILIGTFLYGPWWGLLLTVAASVIQGVTVSAASGVVGILMHVLATGAYVAAAGLIYQKRHTFSGALIALAAGTLTMVLVMLPLNYWISPVFLMSETMTYAAGQETILSLIGYFVAFNAIKAAVNSLITLLVYKSAGKLLKLEIVK